MIRPKREHPKEKTSLHRERYNFKQLIESSPDLAHFVKLNDYDDESIDFFNPDAVKTLNRALLKFYYGIKYWDIPVNYLCPPIPGRADYMHNMADLLSSRNSGKIPTGLSINCLDIGVGANCVYPIIGNHEYGWSFTGTDIDQVSINSARKIVELNPVLTGKVELRLQTNPKHIFNGIIQKDELFDLSVCNPPFHASSADALSGTIRKLTNLKGKKAGKPILNFGGQNAELWCEGGEERFVHDMIIESRQYATSCFWFSTLISKESNLRSVYNLLRKTETVEVKTIAMSQGNKTGRIVTWTFLTPEYQKKWINSRWNQAE